MKVKIYAVPIYVKLYFLAERQAKVVGKSKVAMLEDAVATLSITLLWIFRLPIRGGICPLDIWQPCVRTAVLPAGRPFAQEWIGDELRLGPSRGERRVHREELG